MKQIFKLLVFLVLIIGFSGNIQATMINPGAFGPNAVMESFEGLSPSSNIIVSGALPPRLVPGITLPFTFSSGVTLTYPIPNIDSGSAVFVSDFSLGSVGWGLGVYGGVTAGDVPFGTAYMNTQSNTPSIEYTFPANMLRVGAYVDASSAPITLEVYNASGNLLETQTILPTAVANWRNNFLGIENQSGIRRARFTGSVIVLDGLLFESSPVSVPTMTEWGMILFIILAGVCTICFLRGKKKAQIK